MDPRAGLDPRKSRPHRDSIPDMITIDLRYSHRNSCIYEEEGRLTIISYGVSWIPNINCEKELQRVILSSFFSLTLQPPTSFSLLSDSLSSCSFLILLSPPFYLHTFFNICDPSLPWSSFNSRTFRFPL